MTGEDFISVDEKGESKYKLFQQQVAKVTGAMVSNNSFKLHFYTGTPL